MSENMQMWMEIGFNLSYLVVIWAFVGLMISRRKRLLPATRTLADRLTWAFALLALGDTGHVGFRVIAYFSGGLEANPVLIGLGALSTSFTVTLFYMLLVDAWRLRFQKKFGWLGWTLLFSGVIRLVVMVFPQNQWGQLVAPYAWSLLRNVFLLILGLGVMLLIWRDAIQAKDQNFTWMAIMIAVSFAFYIPVILWIQQTPILGMLMIPKTLAYLGMAWFAYRALYHNQPEYSLASGASVYDSKSIR